MERFGKYSDHVPTALIVVGFVMIFIGWSGAASVDYVQGQVPYVISGGLTGLAFVFFGAAGLVVQTLKKAQQSQEDALRELTESMRKVATAMSVGENGSASNGQGALVVAGASSFHLADCRVVGRSRRVETVPRSEAISDGLEPCRICNP
jgi:hypothetical protein